MNLSIVFGYSWLKSSNKLTFHDPLAVVSIFHPDVCQFEKGFVHVKAHEETFWEVLRSEDFPRKCVSKTY